MLWLFTAMSKYWYYRAYTLIIVIMGKSVLCQIILVPHQVLKGCPENVMTNCAWNFKTFLHFCFFRGLWRPSFKRNLVINMSKSTLSQKRWLISLLIMKCRRRSSYRMKLFIPLDECMLQFIINNEIIDLFWDSVLLRILSWYSQTKNILWNLIENI
jgi:hypothetical protein